MAAVPKILLLSVILGLVAAPVLAAQDVSPVRGLKRAVFLTCLANVLYFLALRFVLPRL